jgi:ribonucleoside-diphosphate reductase alpha chain
VSATAQVIHTDPTHARSADAATVMQFRKRNGSLETVDVNRIVRAVLRCAGGLSHVDPMRVAVKTIGGLYDGTTTAELDRLSIQTADGLIAEKLSVVESVPA